MCASQPRVASTMAVPFEAQRELKPAESMCLMSDKRSELYRNQTFRKLLYTLPRTRKTARALHRCHRHISDSKPLNTSAIVVYRVALKGEFQTGSQTCLLASSLYELGLVLRLV